MTHAEQETIVRWDQEEKVLWLWTAYPPMAAKWTRLGYDITDVAGGWSGRAPLRSLLFRRPPAPRVLSEAQRAAVEKMRAAASRARGAGAAQQGT